MITQQPTRKARRQERDARRALLLRQEAAYQQQLDQLNGQAPALSAAVTDAQAAVVVAQEQLRQAQAAAGPLMGRDSLHVRLGQVRNELADIASEAEQDDE